MYKKTRIKKQSTLSSFHVREHPQKPRKNSNHGKAQPFLFEFKNEDPLSKSSRQRNITPATLLVKAHQKQQTGSILECIQDKFTLSLRACLTIFLSTNFFSNDRILRFDVGRASVFIAHLEICTIGNYSANFV